MRPLDRSRNVALMQRPRVPGARERSRRTTRAAFADDPPPPPAGSASWCLSRLSVPGNSRSNSARELPCARDSSAAAAFGCDLRMARDVNLEDSPVKNTPKTNSPFKRSRDRRFVDRATGQNSLSNAEAKRWTCQKDSRYLSRLRQSKRGVVLGFSGDSTPPRYFFGPPVLSS